MRVGEDNRAGSQADRGSIATETEWQFDAIDMRPVKRWLDRQRSESQVEGNGTVGSRSVTVVDKPARRLVDIYMDTEDWRIARGGYVLRERSAGTKRELTLKETAPAVSGLRKRIEVTEDLTDNGKPKTNGEGPVARRIHALVGNRPLKTVLEVRTTRHPFAVVRGDETLAELALDETALSTAPQERAATLKRVEVEASGLHAVQAGDPNALLASWVAELKRACGLQPATLSKFEAGLLASGVELPAPPDFGPTAVGANPTTGELAYAVLRKQFTAMLVHEPRTRLGEDNEALHDMRVATRRMRAALALFKDALPVRAQHLWNQISWIGGQLGAVRDLDVQLERLAAESSADDEQLHGLDEVVRFTEEAREKARHRLLVSLDSVRYERLLKGMSGMLEQGPPRRSAAARAPALVVVPDLLTERHRAAVKAASRARRSGKPQDLHRLRVRLKRLRYALEFVSDLYEGETAGVVRRVTRLQDSLGLIQDSHVAVSRLESTASGTGSGLSRLAVFSMGRLAERYLAEAERVASTLPKGLKVIDGERWSRLMALVERRRHEVLPAYGWSTPARTASMHDRAANPATNLAREATDPTP